MDNINTNICLEKRERNKRKKNKNNLNYKLESYYNKKKRCTKNSTYTIIHIICVKSM